MNINNNLPENDTDKIDVKSQLDDKIQIQETKESGWIFDKIISMKISFYNTGESNGSSYVKIPLRSIALIFIKNNDKHCFIWSILPSHHPCDNDHPNGVSNYKQNFDGIDFEFFNFSNGFK